MNLWDFRAASARVLICSIAASALLIQTAMAGDHHPTVYLVPVQTSAVPVVTVAAAPVATSTAPYVLVRSKHGHGLAYQVAPVQSVQMVQTASAPVAAAPVQVYSYSQTTVAAAPVAVAASSTRPGGYLIGGVMYVPQGTTGSATGAAPAIGAAPESGALTSAQRTALTTLVNAYKQLPIDEAKLKSQIQQDATLLYEQKTGKTADPKAVDSLTNEALGLAAPTADSSKSSTTPAQQQATMMMVPAAAPVQYFLPVKVKHNLFHQYP